MIEINNTPAKNDDLVQLKCTIPGNRYTGLCRAKAIGSAKDITVVLVNPDGRLRFPLAADKTRMLVLPKSGAWKDFTISGETPSANIGDAVIEARLDKATGTLCGKQPATVFHFDKATVGVTAVGTYKIVGGAYIAVGGPGVTYSAQARIRPAGVDCTAPQVADLRISMTQNVTASSRPMIYDTPKLACTGKGNVDVFPVLEVLAFLPMAVLDSDAASEPLYDQGPGALQPPFGCPGGAVATTNDTPQIGFPPTVTLPAKDLTTGKVIGSITWNFKEVAFNDNFLAWAVVYNTKSKNVCTLKEQPWDLNAKSTAAKQKAAPGAEIAPKTVPILVPPFANDAAKIKVTPKGAPVVKKC